jgi:hypothetical protein
VGWAWLPVGANTWTPATARWVHLNNQLGWIPNGPPLSSKPTKTQLAALPSTVILAGQGANGAIGAGSRIPLARGGMSFEPATPPTPSFNAPPKQSTNAFALAGGTANPKSIVQSAPASFARGNGAPASLRGPSTSTSGLRLARLGSAPQAQLAPHSPPVPAMARSASMGGFRGGYGARGGSSVGTMSTSPTTSVTSSPATSAAGSALHSSGSMGSAGGHR